jgi:hypothetical protein
LANKLIDKEAPRGLRQEYLFYPGEKKAHVEKWDAAKDEYGRCKLRWQQSY